jgi:uncharacterized protein YunC (DUF1805 family)
MVKNERIHTAYGDIEAVWVNLPNKNLILLRGTRGFVMCGYLDLSVAEKCNDAAARITGVSTIEDALNARIESCTPQAQALGIRKGQTVKEVLELIT